jgi:polar amino acid transport system substrate-binding protein
LLGCALFLLAIKPLPTWAMEEIVLNTGVRQPYTMENGGGFLDRLVAEIFRRAGVKARVTVYEASERALINANSGIDDGIALRIKGIEAQYPNLVRVTEKIIDNDFVAYSFNEKRQIKDWSSLQSYQVAYIAGWKVFERNLPESVHTTRVKDEQQLFSLLKMDRTDVILYERWQGLWQIRESGLPAHVHEPALASTEMFMYVHSKHAALVPKLTQALQDMKRDGTYQKIHSATLMSLVRTR